MTQSLAEVLGIAPGNNKPNAYELLGLAAGESNPQRIEAAIEGTVERLKRNQSETDAAVWKQAAAAVTKARKLLADPQLKAAYDAKLAKRAQASTTGKRVRGEAAQDPLRGLLPTIDPLAPFDVDAAAKRASQARPYEPPPLPPGSELQPAAPSTVAAPPPSFDPPVAATPPVAVPQPGAAAEISLVLDEEPSAPTAPVVASAPAMVRPAKRRRRRGSPLLVLGFALLMLVMLSGAGYGVYTLVQREQQRNNPVAQADPNSRRAAVPADRRPSRPVDPVMGNVGPSGPGASPDPSSLPPLTADVDTPLPPPLDNNMSGNDAMSGDNNMNSDNAMTPPASSEPEPMPAEPMQPKPAEPSPAELQAGQAAIAAAEAAIKHQAWHEMKSLAEKAQSAAANEPQQQTADQLFEVADLADYYYHGITKAMEELPSGNTFMLAPGAEVAVVESSAEQIILQVRGRPKTFPFNEMPFILAHKLGSFTMTSDDPTVIAAKAVFQTLAKMALPRDREEAAQWLKELPAEVNGSHPHQIADTLARLFPGSP